MADFLLNIAYTTFFGKPVVMYMGILTLISVLSTAIVGYLNYRNIRIIPFQWHPRLAILAITMALLHGLLALSAYL